MEELTPKKTVKKTIKKTAKSEPKQQIKNDGLNKDGFKAGETINEKDLFVYLAAQRLKNK